MPRHGNGQSLAEEPISQEEALRRELGGRIAEVRSRLRISQGALARRLGITRTRLGRWEKGSHAPSLVQLVRLGLALRTTVDELLTGQATAPAAGSPLPDAGDIALTRRQRAQVSGCVEALLQVLGDEAMPIARRARPRS
jgi:transcriptional regulator with XRE-family HTH domain